jgi:hypothetical protein
MTQDGSFTGSITTMNTRTFLFITALCALSHASIAQNDKSSYEVSCIGFYNVENLFDTLDTAEKNDIEYTPASSNAWNTQKYMQKLDQLGRVISELGTQIHPDGLVVLGLAEVENIEALQDLANNKFLKDRNYQAILIEGPDRRGIDVGMLYNPKHFKPINIKSHTLHMEDSAFHTRDQLVVSGLLDGSPVHVIVAHWPSRSGGEKRSEPNRMAAAELGKFIVDSLLAIDKDATVIYMGDLNDDPVNKSVNKVMMATGDPKFVKEGRLYNPMYDMHSKGVGSLAWRDTWNLFDQIILSPGSLDDASYGWKFHTSRVYNMPYLCSQEGNFKGYPFRTFSGGAWTGGFSDHFPVYVVMKRKL